MNKAFLSSCALCGFASLAFGQSFNIDVGNATPTPGSAFGAGAAQPGFWNTYAGGTLPTLFDLSGSPTAVSMTGTGGTLGAYNDPATFGDDEALMDDLIIVPFLEHYTVSGLAAGTYNVYAYTWTFNALPTDIQVNGLGYQTIGGAWTGGYVQGLTHSLHTLNIPANGSIVVDIHSVNGALGGLTGVQIVQVPAPGGAAAILAGLLAARRRRRPAAPTRAI